MANGVKMAVDEINARGGLIGYHLDYVEIDDKDSNTDQITTAFNRAVSVEKPDVIFSGYHLASGPEFDIVANAGLALLQRQHPGRMGPELHGQPEQVLGHLPVRPDRVLVRTGLRLLGRRRPQPGPAQHTSVKTCSIISGKSAYGTVIATGFETQIKALGWTVVSSDGVTEGAVPDWGPVPLEGQAGEAERALHE